MIQLECQRSKSAATAYDYGRLSADLTLRCQEIPSVFARLNYVAALYDPAGEERRKLIQRFPEWGRDQSQSDAVVRWHHREVFQDWLCLSLEEKLADLHEWASEFGMQLRCEAAQLWLRSHLPEIEPEEDRTAPEAALFRSDLKLLMPIIFPGQRGASFGF